MLCLWLRFYFAQHGDRLWNCCQILDSIFNEFFWTLMKWCGKTVFAWHLVKFLKCLFELSVLQQCHLLLIWCRPLFWTCHFSPWIWEFHYLVFLTSCDILNADLEESPVQWESFNSSLSSSQSYKCIKSPDFVEGGVVAMAEAEAKCSTLGNATLKSSANKLDKLEDAPASLL